MTAAGHIIERTVGEKDVALRLNAGGGTEEVAVDPERVHADSPARTLRHPS